ncbi:VP6 [Rotavirus L]|nr:VP6 [Rotavirus L]
MDLTETVNAVVSLQKRILALAPNTTLTQDGQQTVNDYNLIASRLNGVTFNLRDQLAQLSPITANVPIVPLTVNLNTDDYNAMKGGIDSMFDLLASAIRTEGARQNRAVVLRSQEPEVLRLVQTIGVKTQRSENAVANLLEIDTANLNEEVTKIQNPFYTVKYSDFAQQGNANATGGGILALVGHSTGNKAIMSCIQGRPAPLTFSFRLRAPTSGTIRIIPIPIASRIQLTTRGQPAGAIPVHAECVDVSAHLEVADLQVQFLYQNQVVADRDGAGTFNFPICDTITVTVTPWTQQKNQNANANFQNWQNHNAQAQPAVALEFKILDAVTTVNWDVLTADSAAPNQLMSTIFDRPSFINVPQIDSWSFQELLMNDNMQTVAWSRKLAVLIAAFSAKV